MTPELFRSLIILIGVFFGVVLTFCSALILFWLKDVRQTVKNHWSKILELSERLARIEGWLDPKRGGGKL